MLPASGCSVACRDVETPSDAGRNPRPLTLSRPTARIALPSCSHTTSGFGFDLILHSNINLDPSSSCLMAGFLVKVGANVSASLQETRWSATGGAAQDVPHGLESQSGARDQGAASMARAVLTLTRVIGPIARLQVAEGTCVRCAMSRCMRRKRRETGCCGA